MRDVSRYDYRVIDSRRGMLGLCYVLDSDLTLPRRDDIGYKNLMAVRDAVGGKRLEPRGAFDDHAEWGVCQVGAAAAFVRKEDLEEEDGDLALFGAPGCFTWRGNVFGQSVGSVRRYDTAVDYQNMRQYSKHGHMGLSVTSGRYFEGEVFYVSGAPHAGENGQDRTGEVYFFRKDSADHRLVPAHTLKGEEFGSGFGYSLATLDANGDTTSDLAVGAPFYDGGKTGRGGAVYIYLSRRGSLQRDRSIRILGSQLESQFGLSLATLGDLNRDGFEDLAVGAPYQSGGGAVYIFLGGPSGLRSHGPSKTFLKAEEVADQIITAGDLWRNIPIVPASLATFGSSLSGGMDLDGNGYPDLLVGAYQSNRAFLLRARPIIDISTFVDETNLKGIDPGKASCPDDEESDEACFGFSACFSVDKEVSERGLGVAFKIEAEPQKPVSRVWLRLRDADRESRESVVTDSIRLHNGGRREEHCTFVVGYVSTHADLQTPVQFAMTYTLIQEEPKVEYGRRGDPLPNIDDFPILNQAQAKKKFQATFEKDCGEDEICQSQLKLVPTLKDKTKELGKTPGGYYELELGSLDGSELLLDIEIGNAGDPAYEAEMDVHYPEEVSYIGLGEDAKLNAPAMKNDTWLHFNLGNPFKGLDDEGEATSTRLTLRFSPRDVIHEKLIQFYLTANTSSEQVVDPSTYVNLMIVRRAEVKIVGGGFPSQLHYGGKVRGESDFRELPEVGPLVVHKFLVMNGGPSAVDVLKVEIGWPYQVENGKPQGKWLLYLTEHPLLKNGRGDCYLPPGWRANELNLTSGVHDGITARHAAFPPQNLVFKESQDDRFAEADMLKQEKTQDSLSDSGINDLNHNNKKVFRREVEKVIPPRLVPDSTGGERRVVTLDCDRGTAKCMRITCQIFALQAKASASIEVRARLWNSTLAEDYNDVDKVEVFAKAKVKVDDVVTQDISDDYVGVKTVAEPDSRRVPGGRGGLPEWWVILVAVLAGILLLVIISLCLWKLGFFERKRPEEEGLEDDADFMMSANFEKVRLNGSNNT